MQGSHAEWVDSGEQKRPKLKGRTQHDDTQTLAHKHASTAADQNRALLQSDMTLDVVGTWLFQTCKSCLDGCMDGRTDGRRGGRESE